MKLWPLMVLTSLCALGCEDSDGAAPAGDASSSGAVSDAADAAPSGAADTGSAGDAVTAADGGAGDGPASAADAPADAAVAADMGSTASTNPSSPTPLLLGTTVAGTVNQIQSHFFAFTPAASGVYTLAFTGAGAYVNFDTQPGTFFCQPGPNTCCLNTCMLTLNEQVKSDAGIFERVPLTAGKTYYINVASQSSGNASYTLLVTGPN